ncbi:MAG: hypothetical protein ACKOHG_20665, partial [Planctomycetia bacterium]
MSSTIVTSRDGSNAGGRPLRSLPSADSCRQRSIRLSSRRVAERVFVSGVQESFEKVRAAIEKAKLATGRDYRVIVVGNAGGERDSAT